MPRFLSYTYGRQYVTQQAANMKKSTENKGKFVAYYRVSTQQQGQSGLGLEAQKKAVLDYLNGGEWELLAEFEEEETGKKAHTANRPKLEEALKLCKKARATLVIAKLDRLARNVHFITGLQKSNVDFVAADNPHATKLTVQMLAVFAEHERDMISERTKEALAAAKKRGVILGRHGAILARENAAKAKAQTRELKPVIAGIRKAGKVTVRAIMEELNQRGIKTARGGKWHPQTVNVLLRRIDRKRTA